MSPLMSSLLNFYKIVASGNDFIVVDNRRQMIHDPKAFAHQFCALHTGIGADGILLFENSKKNNFKMRIVNSDGSEAEACGNGFRCIALFAHKILKYPTRMEFESLSGAIQATVNNGRVRVKLPTPKDIFSRETLEVLNHRLHYSFINTGVPHVVIFVEGLSKIDVEKLGNAVRWHSKFQPKGTNVNFVEIKSKKAINVRTYERGVERETQACGTGSTASAIMSSLMGYCNPAVSVYTKGGETLVVDFKKSGQKVTDVFLEGEASIVFEGKLYLDSKKK